MGQDQAAQGWNLDLEARGFCLHVGNAEQDQRRRLAGLVLPVAFDGGDLHRLMLERVQAMEVADHGLDRRHHQGHPHGHRQHLTHCRVVPPAQQVPGRRGADEERGGDEGRGGHVHQAIGEGRVEDHREPVHRNHLAIDDLVALGGLHPAVGSEDPEGRHQRAERHHAGGEEVQATAYTVPAEQHDTKETGLEEEGGQDLVSEQGTSDGSGKIGELAPVGAELIGHDQARDHAHAEVHGEDLRPEVVEVTVRVVAGLQPKAF